VRESTWQRRQSRSNQKLADIAHWETSGKLFCLDNCVIDSEVPLASRHLLAAGLGTKLHLAESLSRLRPSRAAGDVGASGLPPGVESQIIGE
jgi:hypothetical protein